MAQNIPGSLKVSNNCIADLAGYAALECYGVVGMADINTTNSVVRLLPTFRLRKGIDVTANDDCVIVDLHVVVEQGVKMNQVSQNLESTVKFILGKIAELSNVTVRVHIDGIRLH